MKKVENINGEETTVEGIINLLQLGSVLPAIRAIPDGESPVRKKI